MGDDTKFSYFVRELTNIRCDDGYFEGLRSTYDSSQRQGRTPWFWPFRRIAYLASAAAYSFMEHSLGTKSEQQSIISWNVNGLEQKKINFLFALLWQRFRIMGHKKQEGGKWKPSFVGMRWGVGLLKVNLVGNMRLPIIKLPLLIVASPFSKVNFQDTHCLVCNISHHSPIHISLKIGKTFLTLLLDLLLPFPEFFFWTVNTAFLAHSLMMTTTWVKWNVRVFTKSILEEGRTDWWNL